MSPTMQTILALLLVGACVGYVGLSAWRVLRPRGGCGGSCGCGSARGPSRPPVSPSAQVQVIERDALLRAVRRDRRRTG